MSYVWSSLRTSLRGLGLSISPSTPPRIFGPQSYPRRGAILVLRVRHGTRTFVVVLPSAAIRPSHRPFPTLEHAQARRRSQKVRLVSRQARAHGNIAAPVAAYAVMYSSYAPRCRQAMQGVQQLKKRSMARCHTMRRGAASVSRPVPRTPLGCRPCHRDP